MNFLLLVSGIVGGLLWSLFESVSRNNDSKKKPTKRTYLLSTLIGLLAAILMENTVLLPPKSVPYILLGYVTTDLINSVVVILSKKRI